MNIALYEMTYFSGPDVEGSMIRNLYSSFFLVFVRCNPSKIYRQTVCEVIRDKVKELCSFKSYYQVYHAVFSALPCNNPTIFQLQKNQKE